MGAVLQSTAVSVNIRERLDFSCALFDAAGNLIANAPHMPVHLGSMGASVRAVIAANAGALLPGRAWMLNAPYAGGTHLPDITVVTPVFVGGRARARLLRRLARAPRGHRRHHAGLDAAGLAHHPRGRRADRQFPARRTAACCASPNCARCCAGCRWPARNPDQNVLDLKAQLAANARGAAELAALIARVGRRRGHALHGARPGQRGGLRARGHRPAAGRPSPL